MEEAARQQVRVRQRFAVEFARIGEYYSQVIDGLERRRDRERLRSVAAAVLETPSAAGGNGWRRRGPPPPSPAPPMR